MTTVRTKLPSILTFVDKIPKNHVSSHPNPSTQLAKFLYLLLLSCSHKKRDYQAMYHIVDLARGCFFSLSCHSKLDAKMHRFLNKAIDIF